MQSKTSYCHSSFSKTQKRSFDERFFYALINKERIETSSIRSSYMIITAIIIKLQFWSVMPALAMHPLSYQPILHP